MFVGQQQTILVKKKNCSFKIIQKQFLKKKKIQKKNYNNNNCKLVSNISNKLNRVY